MSLYWSGQLGGRSLGRGAERRKTLTPFWTFSVWVGIRHTNGDHKKVFGYVGLELRRMIWGDVSMGVAAYRCESLVYVTLETNRERRGQSPEAPEELLRNSIVYGSMVTRTHL